ncbi:unnamed protein product [Anisakis simplex]|uniref:Battenin n=1 Tax=Anisakis simplex TaxID=6269 RepID=A0A0M3K915_ANISI|nr:unnamed protein product [Anisakis simplex]
MTILDRTRIRVRRESSSSEEEADDTAQLIDERCEDESHNFTFRQKLMIAKPLLKFMVPLSVVYFAEYFINQGLVELLVFDCDHGFALSKSSQYRWYQVLYQIGVFISRSSIDCFVVPIGLLPVLPLLQVWHRFLCASVLAYDPQSEKVPRNDGDIGGEDLVENANDMKLQLMNATFFFMETIHNYISHIWLVFVLVFYEGLLGGCAYVNTFSAIHRTAILEARNKRKMPSAQIPEAVKALGVDVYDPRSADFPSAIHKPTTILDHPAFKPKTTEEHPLYNQIKCILFDGSEPFTDGIDQACAIANALKFTNFPATVMEKCSTVELPKNFEEQLSDMIMHGERYDPSLEKLPKRHDPVLFWIKHPRVYGTPVLKRNHIILDNLYRSVVLNAIRFNQLDFLRCILLRDLFTLGDPHACDRDEPMSGAVQLEEGEERFANRPLVLRAQPHLTVQSPEAIRPWIRESEDISEISKREKVPNVWPIEPYIDLTEDNVYNKRAVVPRNRFKLHLDTILWAREQHQKYPWTR